MREKTRTTRPAQQSGIKDVRPIPPVLIDKMIGDEGFKAIDRTWSAFRARSNGGISPAALGLALFDWSIHLASAPGKQMELAIKANQKAARLLSYAMTASIDPETPACVEPLPGDRRFIGEEWKRRPFKLWAQAFLLHQQWWHNSTHSVPGVTPPRKPQLVKGRTDQAAISRRTAKGDAVGIRHDHAAPRTRQGQRRRHAAIARPGDQDIAAAGQILDACRATEGIRAQIVPPEGLRLIGGVRHHPDSPMRLDFISVPPRRSRKGDGS